MIDIIFYNTRHTGTHTLPLHRKAKLHEEYFLIFQSVSRKLDSLRACGPVNFMYRLNTRHETIAFEYISRKYFVKDTPFFAFLNGLMNQFAEWFVRNSRLTQSGRKII